MLSNMVKLEKSLKLAKYQRYMYKGWYGFI